MRTALLALLATLLTACQGFVGDNIPATLETELTAYVDQAVTLRQESQMQRTSVVATVEASGTQVAQYRAYNADLVVTVRAGQVPTPERVFVAPQGGTLPLEMLNTADGIMRFMQVGPAGYVDPVTRCFDSHQRFFRLGTFNIVYMTALGVNVQPGTRVNVDWSYAGEIVYRNGWVAPEFYERICVAIPLTPGDASFSPGNWGVTLFVNGEPVNPSSFTILEG